MDLYSEFIEIISLQPSISYLELINCAKSRGWNLDTTDLDNAAAAAMPAWKALASHANIYAENKSERSYYRQIIQTGEIFTKDEVLASEFLEGLKDLFVSHINIYGSAPLLLGDFMGEPRLDLSKSLVDISRTILTQIYRNSPQHVQSCQDQRHVILMNRCLLRRTYCSSLEGSVTKNRNNQSWHQDTNQKFQDMPMLTIWIPLQNNAGILIPGIEIANLHPDRFIPFWGDGVDSLEEVVQNSEHSNIRTLVPTVQAGGCVVFNGLTFHRTYTASQMSGHRDALLVRISLESYSKFFPGDRSKDIFFDL